MQSRGSSVGIVTGYRREHRGSIPDSGKIFLFFIVSRWNLRPTQPPIKWVPGALSSGMKRQERETDHSPPSCAEIKNGGAISPCHHGIVLNELSTETALPYLTTLLVH
jgi:hypothetical protein